MINFPDNPSNNQVFTSGNQTWVYDGTKWLAMGVAGVAVFGVTDGSSAAPGVIGEVISNVVAAPGNVLSSSVVSNIASIALTAGDWDVQGELILTVGATAAGILQGGISGTSLSMGNGLNGSRVCFVTTFPGGANVLPVRACRASLAAPATYYLVGYANAAGVSAAGTIWARRMR